MYKALEVEFISKKSANYASKTECTYNMTMRIKRIVLDLHDVIADSKKVVLFED